MTLVLGIAAQWGFWMSVDHRLTELRSGRPLTDTSVKYIGVKAVDGEAMVGYTGLGMFGGEDLSDWIRHQLRGVQAGLEESVDHIARCATRDFGSLAFRKRILHVFVVGAFLNETPYLVAVANTDTPLGQDKPKLRPDFVITALRIAEPMAFFGGSGYAAISDEDRQLLHDTARRRPRDSGNYVGLLHAINKRAAESRHRAAKTITAGCVVAHLGADGESHLSVLGTEGSEEKIPMPPFVMFGIDTTELMRTMMANIPNVDEAAWEAAARRSVEKKQ